VTVPPAHVTDPQGVPATAFVRQVPFPSQAPSALQEFG
jgi:hypothetical protein